MTWRVLFLSSVTISFHSRSTFLLFLYNQILVFQSDLRTVYFPKIALLKNYCCVHAAAQLNVTPLICLGLEVSYQVLTEDLSNAKDACCRLAKSIWKWPNTFLIDGGFLPQSVILLPLPTCWCHACSVRASFLFITNVPWYSNPTFNCQATVDNTEN